MRGWASLTIAALTLITAPAAASDPTPAPPVSGSSGDGSFIVESAQESESRVEQPSVTGGADAQVEPATPAIILGESTCVSADQVSDSILGTSAVTFCGGSDEEPAVVTLSAIRSAFARLDLPAATLVIQPPDGLTLVNFDTNFYTTSTRPITRTVTLLGQQVTLEATPAEFHWDFGDGGAVTTTEPGAPYPDLTVTHNYLQTGTYRPSLATTFTGRFRVGDGAWQQIPGTVTIDGTGQALRAIEAQPKLVGY